MTQPARNASVSERHVRILDAAERVFSTAGIHSATMSDVALEAQMSPGNLYRYFPSKEAIVAGLAERDRTEIVADFARLAEGPVTFDTLEALGRRHLVDEPRRRMMITLQIWAESTRNPDVAKLCASVEGAVNQGLQAFVHIAKANGELPPDLADDDFILAIFMLVDGFMRLRATKPEFDAARAADLLFKTIRILAISLKREAPASLSLTPHLSPMDIAQ
jgi:TetR/AcrR family transcriptional regulator, repressor for uid operon